MKITIRQPLSFSEIGRKDNQEDYVYPNPLTVGEEQRFFILCDGMGGHEHGELASSTVAEAMGEYLSNVDKSVVTPDDFNKALSHAYDCLDEKDSDDSGKKMGTTMTCIVLHDGGVLVAHIGDSRVYHVNPKTGVRHVTSDHSLVNDLLKAGELTEEEARNYPHKNIITRAMQPNQERRSKAEVSLISDVESGDYIFMCCDGVLEQLTNEHLCEILADRKMKDADKLAAIKAECDGKTKDNYTCWLIPIDKVEKDDTDVPNSDDDIIQAVSEDAEDQNEFVKVPEVKKQQAILASAKSIFAKIGNSKTFVIMLIIALIVIVCLVFGHVGELLSAPTSSPSSVR